MATSETAKPAGAEKDIRGVECLHPDLREENLSELTGFSPVVDKILKGMPSEVIGLRLIIEDMAKQIDLPPDVAHRIRVTKNTVQGSDGNPSLSMVFVKPVHKDSGPLPAIFFIHSGALCTGTAETELDTMARWAAELGCNVVSPNFRLIPEAPYPAALEDLEAVHRWILEHAPELEIIPTRIVAAGASCGGLLAAALSYRLKETGNQQFCAQMLLFPVLDDRFELPSNNIYFDNVWLPRSERLMWQAYLGNLHGQPKIPPAAVPGRTIDFSRLPPTFIHTAELDHGRDNCLAYAQGLLNTGIFVDLHLWGGAYHAFDQIQPEADLARRYNEMVTRQLRDALSGSLVR